MTQRSMFSLFGIHEYIHMCVYVYVYICVCVCVSICVCICVCKYVYVHIHICVCICAPLYACVWYYYVSALKFYWLLLYPLLIPYRLNFWTLQHCAGINCLAVLKSSSINCDYLFTGSRDGTLKRWTIADDEASCLATFESHVDWVWS